MFLTPDTYYNNHFMALWTLSRTTRVSQYQKVHFTIFWIFLCKIKITQADAPSIRMDCHSIQTNWCHSHYFYAGCPFWHNTPNLSWIGTGTKYAGLHTHTPDKILKILLLHLLNASPLHSAVSKQWLHDVPWEATYHSWPSRWVDGSPTVRPCTGHAGTDAYTHWTTWNPANKWYSNLSISYVVYSGCICRIQSKGLKC